MKIFRFENVLNPSRAVASEQLIYKTARSCLTSFTYPNHEDIQGIGLHSHPSCDDVEMVLFGTGYHFENSQKLRPLPPGTVIINGQDSIHSLVAPQNGERLVAYGYRCPPDDGGLILDWQKHEHHQAPVRRIEMNLHLNTPREGQGDNTQVELLRVTGQQTLKARPCPEQTLVVARGCVKVYFDNQQWILETGDLMVWDETEDCTLLSDDADVILLRPLND